MANQTKLNKVYMDSLGESTLDWVKRIVFMVLAVFLILLFVLRAQVTDRQVENADKLDIYLESPCVLRSEDPLNDCPKAFGTYMAAKAHEEIRNQKN